jgi:NADPH:quinone reductase-like Zn-dependent oxidoreductase
MSTTESLIYASNGADKMAWKSDLVVPEKLKKNQLLIRTLFAGINPVDYKLTHVLPLYLSRKGGPVGQDVCGIVEQVGSGVGSKFSVGDKVFGFGPGLARRTVVDAATVAKVPEGVPLDMAGAAPVAAVTAYQALRDFGGFEGTEAKRVLVIGASGGVGSCAVQIAKAKCPPGSSVVAVCSGKNADFVKSLGADEVLDYTADGFKLDTALPGKSIDIVFDCVTSADDHSYIKEGMPLLKEKSGKYVAINTAKSFEWIKLALGTAIGIKPFRGQYALMMAQGTTADLEAVAELIRDKKLKVEIEKSLPLEEKAVREGYQNLKDRRTRGKIVVKME